MEAILESEEFHEVMHVSDELRVELMCNHIEPFYRNIVQTTLRAKQTWRQAGITFDTASKGLIAIGGILSFSTAYFPDQRSYLSLISGSISCLSLGTIQFASFCFKEHNRQSKELNAILKKLKIETIPLLNRSTSEMAEITPPKNPPIRRGIPRSTTIDNYNIQDDSSVIVC